MLYEPEILHAHAERAGLKLYRTERGTVKIEAADGIITKAWIDLVRSHKHKLLEVLPAHVPVAEPTRYALRMLPAQGNYDLFDGVTPYRGKTHKNQKTKHDLPPPVMPRRPAPVGRREPA